MNIRAHVLLLAIILSPALALAQDDVSLYDERGNAVAYVALNDARTIFLWGGKPVAYLQGDDPDIQEVYGFNGRRLGLLTAGLIIDKDGKTLCATAAQMSATQPDPPKPARWFIPVKAYPKFGPPPAQPTATWSDRTCVTSLSDGRE